MSARVESFSVVAENICGRPIRKYFEHFTRHLSKKRRLYKAEMCHKGLYMLAETRYSDRLLRAYIKLRT